MSAMSGMMNAQSIGAITQMSDSSDGRRSRLFGSPHHCFGYPLNDRLSTPHNLKLRC